MNETVQLLLMFIGTLTILMIVPFTVIYVFVCLERKFTKWRRNECKIKCLCKHEYTVDGVWYYVNLKCEKCGKIIYIEMNDRWRDAIKDEFRKGNINEE